MDRRETVREGAVKTPPNAQPVATPADGCEALPSVQVGENATGANVPDLLGALAESLEAAREARRKAQHKITSGEQA